MVTSSELMRYYRMVSPYTVGLCIRSWCLTLLLLSITGSLIYITLHLVAISRHHQEELHEAEVMKLQMASIDFRLKSRPKVETGDDAFVFADASHRQLHAEQQVKSLSLKGSSNNSTSSRERTGQEKTNLGFQPEAPHGDTSKVLNHESHVVSDGKVKPIRKTKVTDPKDSQGQEKCLDAVQAILDKVDVYFEDQWHLTYHGKHRHRMEVMKNGFYLNKTIVRATLKKKRSCLDYVHEVYSEHLIMSDVFRSLRSESSEVNRSGEVTMMTQLSGNRLDKLLLSLEHWSGPVSVAIFARATAIRPVSHILCRSALSRLQKDLKIHIILRVKEKYYPVNLLRNVALRAVDTEYVFLSDADFVPMATSHDAIQWHLSHLSMKHRGRVALIVPAYEALPVDPYTKLAPSTMNSSTYVYPETKMALLQQERLGLAEPFHITFFPAAHKPTNFTKWRTATRPYRIHYGPYFEPYVVVATKAIPPYVEEFLGRQMNKVTHIRALYAQHFQFWVLPDVYTIHLPHEVERGPQDYWRCVNTVANMVMLRIQNAEESSLNMTAPVNMTQHIYKSSRTKQIPKQTQTTNNEKLGGESGKGKSAEMHVGKSEAEGLGARNINAKSEQKGNGDGGQRKFSTPIQARTIVQDKAQVQAR